MSNDEQFLNSEYDWFHLNKSLNGFSKSSCISGRQLLLLPSKKNPSATQASSTLNTSWNSGKTVQNVWSSIVF